MNLRTMTTRLIRLFVVLLAVVAYSSGYADPLGQEDLKDTKVKISIKEGKIIEIMNEISSSTEYFFIYEDAIKNELNKKIKIEHGENLHDLLGEISKKSNLEFRAVNNNIVVRRRVEEQSRIENTGALQRTRITGKVTSAEDNSGLPGVNVVEKGTTNGTVTDIDGNYSLEVPGAETVLVFSSVGFNSEELTVGMKSVIDLQMVPDIKALDEIVVTALGMKKDRKSLGYNISSVNSENLETGGTSNVLRSLEGKITGVQMNSLTSSPTASVMFNIRGATSLKGIMDGKSGNINNETQPLIVVDGVTVATNTVGTTGGIDVGNYMSSINPNDVESISVLKGASAAALYGSQAGNGVILITTKNGSRSKKGVGVSFSSAISFDQAYSVPPVQRKFFQGDEDGSPLTEDKKGLGWAIDDNVNNSVAIPRWNLLAQDWEESVLEARGDKNPLLAFLETGVMYDNNVAITGNYDKGSYRLNIGNVTSNSVVPSNKTIRNNVSFTSEYDIAKNVKVTSQASYSHTFVPNQSHIYGKREDNPLAHAMSMPINMPTMDVWMQADNWLEGWEGSYQNTPYLKNPGEDRLSRVNSDGYDKAVGKNNPYFAAEEIIRTYTKDVVFGKVQLDWQLAEPFGLTLRSGLTSNNFNFERKVPWGAERAEGGAYEQQNSNSLSMNNDFLLTFNDYFVGNKLYIDALAGFSYNLNQSNSAGFSGNNLATPNSFTFGSLPAATRQSASFSNDYASRNYGLYGTVTFGWQDMLYLELTGRNDWVGVLDHEKDNHFYPGMSLSWITTETFDMPSWINKITLRGGYAETGYGIGNPVNLDSYGISSKTWDGVAMGTIGGSLVDKNIEPELNVTKEVGIDFGFFDNRVFGEFTAYSKDHINQIQELPVVSSTGFSSVLTNMGSVKSKGIEASLTVVPIRNSDWTWSITGNVTSFNSVIDELDERFSEKFYDYEGSAKLSLFKGSKVGDLYAADPIARIQTGKYKGMMLTGIEGIIEESIGTTDYIKQNGYLGNMNPDAILGFSTDVKFKNWSFGIVSSLRLGGVFISETQKIMIDDGMADIGAIYADKYDEYWTGGRFAGGLESMPNPEDIFPGEGWEEYRDAYSGYMEYYNGDPRYFGYWNAVFIDPNVDLSSLSPEEKLSLPDEYYVKNGENPLYTMYAHPYYMEGQELWSGAQFRTWDATNFKIKEINLTYRFNRSLVERLHCQDISVTGFVKNAMFWAKNKMNEDPETAFRDGISGMGISQFGLPPIRTMGMRLAVSF